MNILEIEKERDKLQLLLNEAKAKISELQTSLDEKNEADSDYLGQFDDTNTSVIPSAGEGKIVSLCGVTTDYNGQKWLVRYADLESSGQYNRFRKRDDIPPFFSNRDRIFQNNGPSNDGFYGIWTWSAIPNERNSSRDYVISKFIAELDVIEIFTVEGISNLEDLVKQVKKGIKHIPHSKKMMISFCISNGNYMGILCNKNQIKNTNNTITVSKECAVVPVYKFNSKDIMRLDNELCFYRKAFAGVPNKLLHLKDTLDIVKDIVLSSISWPAYKARGVIHNDYRRFKDFLGLIPVGDITRKIEVECRCTSERASNLLDEFLDSAWKYFNDECIEDSIILSAISASSELQEKTKEFIRIEWEKENKRLIDESKDRLIKIEEEIKAKTANLIEIQNAVNKTKLESERLEGIIAEKEKLAKDVEEAVDERIQKARDNAADFIADMAFYGIKQTHEITSNSFDTSVNSYKSISNPYYTDQTSEDLNDLEAHHSWDDVMNTAFIELGEAGVSGKYRNGLASFLCSAYINKQPILLVGPNSYEIALAFAAAVAGNKYGVLCCEGNFTSKAIDKIGLSGEDVVIINNLLGSGWINRLPEILSCKDCFYICVHPYAEDIQVEPKSLYGFMLPLFTEFFVDDKASGKYYGGYFADDFKEYSANKDAQKDLNILSSLALNPLVRKKIRNLIATMHGVYTATSSDDEFLFAILPIAYALLDTNKLAEAIADPQKDLSISANLKRDLAFLLGETNE